MLRFTEREAWKLTPYKIIKLFEYHKEYNPQQFKRPAAANQLNEDMADIDIALGGF